VSAASDWQGCVGVLGAAFASTDPTPGGGAAAGAAAALGCALGEMAAGISARSKKIDEARRAELLAARDAFAKARAEFEGFVRRDVAAFDQVMAAYGLPKEDPRRAPELQRTLRGAAEVPLEAARRSLAVLGELRACAPKAVGTVASDVRCAEHLLRAAGLCALENVSVNRGLIKDAAFAEGLGKAEAELRAGLGQP